MYLGLRGNAQDLPWYGADCDDRSPTKIRNKTSFTKLIIIFVSCLVVQNNLEMRLRILENSQPPKSCWI